jgi:hypothetical protein
VKEKAREREAEKELDRVGGGAGAEKGALVGVGADCVGCRGDERKEKKQPRVREEDKDRVMPGCSLELTAGGRSRSSRSSSSTDGSLGKG